MRAGALGALRLVVAGVALASVLASCGGSRADSEPAQVRILRDFTFAMRGESALQLDLYLPENYDRPLPIVVWLHGGGWLFGSRARCPAVLAIDSVTGASCSRASS